jgi:surfactin synthase thioesterase subunit
MSEMLRNTEKLQLVLLPGLDGTSLLFHPVLEALPLSVPVRAIRYSDKEKQSYNQMVKEVKAQLPSQPFVLVAESFGGYLAYLLSLDKSLPIEKVILVASFLTPPRIGLKAIVKMLPISLMFKLPLIRPLVKYFCFAQYYSDNLFDLLTKAVSHVKPNVLAKRVSLIFNLKPSQSISDVQTIVITANHDRLISRRTSKFLATRFDKVKIKNVDGPHFLLQTRPKKLAEVILHEMTEQVNLETQIT